MTPSPDIATINPDLASRGERIAAGIAEGRHQCAICGEWIEDGADMDGCRHPLCEENGDDTWRR